MGYAITKARFVHLGNRGLRSLFLFCMATAAFGQTRDGGQTKPELGPLSIQPQTVLAEISSGELTSTSAGLTVPMNTGFSTEEGINLQVEREVPSLWRLKISDESDIYNLVIGYELVSLDGESDRLSLPAARDSSIEVQLRAIPPAVVERNRDGVTIEGGIRMDLDIRAARLSGTYRGRLTVTVNHL